MRATAYEFAAELDKQIEGLAKDEYLRKSGRAKLLREELFPLSRLGLHLKLPGNAVVIESFENNHHADGVIKITGFVNQEFEVQVTFAGYKYEDALRDELLSSSGFAPGAGKIYRDRATKKIVAEMSGVDYNEHVGRIASAVINRIKDKLSKSYPKGTILLIAFDDPNLNGRFWWNELFKVLGETDNTGNVFARIYLFNCWTNEICLYKSSPR